MKAKTGCSAVRLAHLLWEQGVPGSNPGTPTKLKEFYVKYFYLSYPFHLHFLQNMVCL